MDKWTPLDSSKAASHAARLTALSAATPLAGTG